MCVCLLKLCAAEGTGTSGATSEFLWNSAAELQIKDSRLLFGLLCRRLRG